VRRTWPTGYRQRHQRVFDLARALKSLPRWRDASAEDVRPWVEQWWAAALPHVRTKAWSHSWKDFVGAWERVRHPDRGATLAGVREFVFKVVPLGNPYHRSEDDLLRLSLACEQLATGNGGRPFPLGVDVVSELLGVSPATASRLRRRMVKAAELKQTGWPDRRKGLAAEYRYTGPFFDNPA
jgi:hypothetical protein